MDKWINRCEACIYISVSVQKGLLLCREKELSTDTWYNTDEPWRHHAKWRKPDIKGATMHDSIYMKCPEQVNPQEQKGDVLNVSIQVSMGHFMLHTFHL